MWGYVICAVIWLAFIFGWLIPVARKRITYEIYEACGLGGFFSLLALNLGGAWTSHDILVLKIIGLILYLPAIFFVVLAFINLRHKGKPEDAWEHTTAIIRGGVYGIVRHPLYFGTSVWTAGVMLVFPSILSSLLGVACIICFWMASKKEDAFNIEKFGDAYKEYMKRVPAWNAFKIIFTKGGSHG